MPNGVDSDLIIDGLEVLFERDGNKINLPIKKVSTFKYVVKLEDIKSELLIKIKHHWS